MSASVGLARRDCLAVPFAWAGARLLGGSCAALAARGVAVIGR